MIVMKFGGTSVGDAAAIRQAGEIVAGRLARRPLVVVSAMAKVTDALLDLARMARERRFDAVKEAVEDLRQRHLDTARQLLADAPAASECYTLENVEAGINAHIAELESLATSVATLGELTPRSQDAIVSFGERLSSMLVAASFRARGIPARWVDARRLLVTDDRFTAAVPDFEETARRLREEVLPHIEAERVVVAQGFIGATREGVTTTIGRGGSDYSAAIFGAALDAEAIEIWTDVDGLMTADPRVVPNARRIRVISFAEAAELSYFGAKVLHPNTVKPAIERGIPVHIFNTRNPDCEGTLIVNEARPSSNLIKSIAFKRNVTMVNITSTRMLMAHGFLHEIFKVFEKYQTSVDVVTTSEVSVSITLDSAESVEPIRAELSRIGDVSVERNRAIVCVVGDNLKVTPGVAARVFQAIESVNVNMISQGASEINLTFVIDEADVERVARLLHEAFFTDPDPAVFA